MMAHFYAFSETQDAEELHRMRVEIKKIFALTALLELGTRNFDFSSCLNPLKTISMKTGEIRNIQLTLRTIIRYSGENSAVCELQKARLTNLIRIFCLKTALYVKIFKKVRQSVLGEIYDIENSCIFRWYEDELKKLSQFFTKKYDHKNIHEGRKILKKLLYVYAILQKPLQNKLNLNKHYLRKLEVTIGKWHDVTVSMEILSRSNFTGNEAVKKLSDRKQKLLRSCRELSKCFFEKCYKCDRENN